jgi:hypothetical protein
MTDDDLIERARTAVAVCWDCQGDPRQLAHVLADVARVRAHPRTLPAHVWPGGRPFMDELPKSLALQ